MLDLRRKSAAQAGTAATVEEEAEDEMQQQDQPFLILRRGHDWNIELFVHKNCKYTQVSLTINIALICQSVKCQYLMLRARLNKREILRLFEMAASMPPVWTSGTSRHK